MFERAELGALFGVGDPLRVGLHGRATPRAVRCVLVGPDMDELIYVAGFGHQIGERLTEVTGLRPFAESLVKCEMFLDGSGRQV